MMDELFKKAAKPDVMDLAQRRGRLAGLPQPEGAPKLPLDIAMQRLQGNRPLEAGAMYKYGTKNLPSPFKPTLPKTGGF